MQASADAGPEIATASAMLRGKEEVTEFDVFPCYNWENKPSIRRLAQLLRERGLRPWLDERELGPGTPWQPPLEDVIVGIPTAAVIVGSRMGDWQETRTRRDPAAGCQAPCTVVPVLLPCARSVHLPVFLEGLTWVDLTVTEPDPIDQFMWAIADRHPAGYSESGR